MSGRNGSEQSDYKVAGGNGVCHRNGADRDDDGATECQEREHGVSVDEMGLASSGAGIGAGEGECG